MRWINLTPWLGLCVMAAVLCAGETATSSPVESAIEAMERTVADEQKFLADLAGIVTSDQMRPELRAAALKRYLRLSASRQADSTQLCTKLLLIRGTPDQLLDDCVAELVRINMARGGLQNAIDSLYVEFIDAPKGVRESIERADRRVNELFREASMPAITGERSKQGNWLVQPPKIELPQIAEGAELKDRGTALSSQLQSDVRGLIDRKDWKSARSRLKEWFAAFPDNESNAPFLLLVRLVTGETGEQTLSSTSRERFVLFMDANGGTPERIERADYYLCEMLYTNGEYEQALDALHAYQSRHAASTRVASSKLLEGNALVLLNRNTQALTIFQALAGDSASAPPVVEKALFLTGWTYLFAQDMPNARTQFQKLVAKFPNGEYAKKARELLARKP